ncbi:MAG: 30S ribosomal protein S19 [Planctomycetota bacterium]|jgi:small subunit ribosomal protein S19
MSRSLKKGPFVDEKLERKVLRMVREGKRDPITTWARACTITPDFVGHTFMVHNGRQHQRVYVVEDMVGHKLGEFAPTRMFRGHTNKKESSKSGPGR